MRKNQLSKKTSGRTEKKFRNLNCQNPTQFCLNTLKKKTNQFAGRANSLLVYKFKIKFHSQNLIVT